MTRNQISLIDQALNDRIFHYERECVIYKPTPVRLQPTGSNPDGLDGKRWIERYIKSLRDARAAFRLFHNYNGEIVPLDS